MVRVVKVGFRVEEGSKGFGTRDRDCGFSGFRTRGTKGLRVYLIAEEVDVRRRDGISILTVDLHPRGHGAFVVWRRPPLRPAAPSLVEFSRDGRRETFEKLMRKCGVSSKLIKKVNS
jgi:hypothetical protein